MSDHDQIRELLGQYAHVHDQQDLAGFLDLFTVDGRMSVISGAQPAGKAALESFIGETYAKRRAAHKRMKHMYANSVIEIDGDHASVYTDVVAYESVDDGPWAINMIGQVQDRLRRERGRWLFEERSVLDGRPQG